MLLEKIIALLDLIFSTSVLLFCKSVTYMEMPRWLYTTEHFFFFFFTTAEHLRLNLHDNVCGISFFLPGKCISLSFELIMSPASSKELAGENTNVCQGWVVFFFNDFRKIL